MDSSQSDPNSLQQARQYLAAGQHDQATQILRAHLEINSSDAETNALMGAALSMGGKLAESLPYLERAVGLDPQKASYYFNLGAVAERLGDTERALNCYRRALELDSTYKRAAEGVQRLFKLAAPQPPIKPQAPPTPYGQQPAMGGFAGAQPMRTDLAGNPVEQPPQSIPQGPPPGYPPPAAYPGGAPGWLPPPTPYYPTGAGPGPYAHPPEYPAGDWNYVPQSVKSARLADFFLGFLYSLGALVNILVGTGAMSTTTPTEPMANIVNLIVGIVMVPVVIAHFWIGATLKRGGPSMWTAQLVLSIISCIAFCGCGTIFHLIVLAMWFNNETKAWFGTV